MINASFTESEVWRLSWVTPAVESCKMRKWCFICSGEMQLPGCLLEELCIFTGCHTLRNVRGSICQRQTLKSFQIVMLCSIFSCHFFSLQGCCLKDRILRKVLVTSAVCCEKKIKCMKTPWKESTAEWLIRRTKTNYIRLQNIFSCFKIFCSSLCHQASRSLPTWKSTQNVYQFNKNVLFFPPSILCSQKMGTYLEWVHFITVNAVDGNADVHSSVSLKQMTTHSLTSAFHF